MAVNNLNQNSSVTSYNRRYLVLAAMMLSGIMGPIDASIVNVTLPTIAGYFKVDVALAQWVPMIYLLTISSLLLFYGRLGDIFGYKKIYLAGLAGFTIASALCGLSPTIQWLIAFRAVQGLAAGMMMAVPYAIITASFPPEERGKAMGINAMSISIGLATGPSLGGFITASLGWHFVFFINIPVGIAGLLWANHVVPDIKGQRSKVDIFGAATAFITLFCFLLFVNRFQRYGLSYTTGILLVIAAFSFISFIRIEARVKQPMLNLSLFANRTFSFANISALLNFMSQYVMVFVTPFFLQRVLIYSPGYVGLLMTAFPLAVMVAAPFSGSLSDRIGTRILACIGASLCTVSLIFMSTLPLSAGPADIIWRLALFGLGTGIFQSPNNSTVMGSVPKSCLGISSGVLATTRNVGMVLGIATAGAVMYAFAPPYVLEKANLEAADTLVFLTGLRYAYLAGAILTGTAALTSLVKADIKHASN